MLQSESAHFISTILASLRLFIGVLTLLTVVLVEVSITTHELVVATELEVTCSLWVLIRVFFVLLSIKQKFSPFAFLICFPSLETFTPLSG